MRWLPIALVAAGLGVSAAPARALVDADGIHVVSVRAVDARLLDVQVSTPALAKPVGVRILLPAGYDSSTQRYPVLYLLHGAFADYTSWTAAGDAEAITAGQPVIAVMPEGGVGGWYSDWLNHGRGGPPEWERFHVDQLIPWVDRNLRTVPSRRGRAIAGLSMGGFGAMSYAARHPDLFAYAGSFSGAVDSNNPLLWPVVDGETLVESGGLDPDLIWGSPVTDNLVWRAHNPWDLAPNLRGMALSVYTGDGPLDPIEVGVHAMSVSFHQRLAALGIPHVWDDYGPGTHSWPYWKRDLRSALPAIMATFAHPPRAPRPFSYRSGDGAYGVYGWTVTMHRRAPGWSELDDAGHGGFTLRGSGAASVVTGPLYSPTARYAVGGAVLRPDAAGRLHVDVPRAPATVPIRRLPRRPR